MLLMGIAGGTGSGKSTFVRRIFENLKSNDFVIIPQDNYYRDQSHLTFEQRQKLNFDHPSSIEFDLLIEHIKLLKAGKSFELPHYSHITCTREKETTTIHPNKVVVIEGIMVLVIQELVDLMDMKFYVDADDDDRFIRCVKRDIEERARTFESVVDRYYKTVKPMHLKFIEPSKKTADLIIPHGGENKVAIDLIASRIKVELLK